MKRSKSEPSRGRTRRVQPNPNSRKNEDVSPGPLFHVPGPSSTISSILYTTDSFGCVDGPGYVQEDQPGSSPSGDAPNGGYGWVVVFGCFLSHVVFGGVERSEGIFFLEFQEKFGHSTQITSLPGAFVTGLRLFVAPIASAMSYRYGVRRTCFLGSALMFAGMFLNAFITNFYLLFLSHAVLQGIGRGLLYTPSLIIVADYFDKKRGIANGLSTSGTGMGTFVLPPLLQFLFDFYGYTGAFMVIAAMSLNTAISAMLYKPLPPPKDTFETTNKQGLSPSLPGVMSECFNDSLHRDRSEAFSEVLRLARKTNFGLPDTTLIAAYGSESSAGSIRQLLEFSKEMKQRRILTQSQVCITDEFKRDGRSTLRSFISVGKRLKEEVVDITNRVSVNLMKNSPFIMFCISIALFTAASKSAFTFMPALITSKGYTPSDAAAVLSVTGAADILGRIGAGLLFDMVQNRLVRPIICNVFIIILAVVIFILPLLDDYVAISLTCAFNSLLTGAYVSQKTVISMDVLGPSNIPRSIGFFIFFQGFGVTIGIPTMAAVETATSNYDLSFYLCGAIMVGAGFFMALSVMYIRDQEREIASVKARVEVLGKGKNAG